MLQPKRTKYRKTMKSRNRGLAAGHNVSFGEIGLQATGRCRMTARQIEAARRAMTRHVKRQGKIWIRVFPDKPITKKPLEVRMGKGKGSVDYWCAPVKAGTILFEVGGNASNVKILEALKKGCSKLQVRTRIISKYNVK